MVLTMADITPLSLCIATQDLLDIRRYQANFCDNLLLRGRDQELQPHLTKVKRELNAMATENKFLDGHKAVLVSNIDKIIGLVAGRYANMNYKVAEQIVENARELIRKVLSAESFENLSGLEPEFRKKVTFPVYELFNEQLKRTKTSLV